MTIATLTSKGQVTLPKVIRESLHLHSGDKIEIVITKTNEAVIRPISKNIDDVFCKLYDSDRETVSIETIDHVIRTRMQEKFR